MVEIPPDFHDTRNTENASVNDHWAIFVDCVSISEQKSLDGCLAVQFYYILHISIILDIIYNIFFYSYKIRCWIIGSTEP